MGIETLALAAFGIAGWAAVICRERSEGPRSIYRYPPNARVAAETEGLEDRKAVSYQVAKAASEIDEVLDAIAEGDPDWRVLEELADVEHAIEGVQRMFPDSAVAKSRVRVRLKCSMRGDYRAEGGAL